MHLSESSYGAMDECTSLASMRIRLGFDSFSAISNPREILKYHVIIYAFCQVFPPLALQYIERAHTQ